MQKSKDAEESLRSKSYYGFTPHQLTEDLKDAVLSAVKEIESDAMSVMDNDNINPLIMKQNNIEHIEPVFAKFEIECKKVFGVVQSHTYSDADILRMKNEFEEVKQEFIRQEIILKKSQDQERQLEQLLQELNETIDNTPASNIDLNLEKLESELKQLVPDEQYKESLFQCKLKHST